MMRRHEHKQYVAQRKWSERIVCDECQDRKVVPEYDNAGGFIAKPCPLCVDPKCDTCDVVVPAGYNRCASCGDAAGP